MAKPLQVALERVLDAGSKRFFGDFFDRVYGRSMDLAFLEKGVVTTSNIQKKAFLKRLKLVCYRNTNRRQLALRYKNLLSKLVGLELLNRSKHTYHVFYIQKDSYFSTKKRKFSTNGAGLDNGIGIEIPKIKISDAIDCQRNTEFQPNDAGLQTPDQNPPGLILENPDNKNPIISNSYKSLHLRSMISNQGALLGNYQRRGDQLSQEINSFQKKLILNKLMLKLARYSNTKLQIWKHFRVWKQSTFLGIQSGIRVKQITSTEQLEEENERLKNELENRSQSELYQSNQSLGNNIENSNQFLSGKTENYSKIQLKLGAEIIGDTANPKFDKKVFESSRELKEELALSYLNYIQIQNDGLKNTALRQESLINKLREKSDSTKDDLSKSICKNEKSDFI